MASQVSSFVISVVSLSVESISSETFTEKLKKFVKEGKDKKAQLILFPEFSIAPILDAMRGDEFAATQFLENEIRKLAIDYELYICGGSGLYKIDNKIYNQSFLVNPEGTIVYQPKMNLIQSEKEAQYVRGDKLHIIDTPFVRLAICMCYDIEFPELVRKLVLAGVDLILTPSYTVDKYGVRRVQHCAQARAIENHIFVAKSCLIGNNGHNLTPCGYGQSALYSPIDYGFSENGVISESKGSTEEVIIGEIDLKKLYELRRKSSTSPLQDYKSLKLKEFLINCVKI